MTSLAAIAAPGDPGGHKILPDAVHAVTRAKAEAQQLANDHGPGWDEWDREAEELSHALDDIRAGRMHPKDQVWWICKADAVIYEASTVRFNARFNAIVAEFGGAA